MSVPSQKASIGERAATLPRRPSQSTDVAERGGTSYLAGRMETLSGRIIGEVRQALVDKRLAAGDFLGTEKDIAARYGVSRMVARDALRSLQALGIAEIKMGKGGGARIARGNPRLFAEALAIQLDLTGVTVEEIIDAQRAIECLATELAAERATKADIERLRFLLREAEAHIDERELYTRLCKAFHMGIAEASGNRVLVVQLVSLQHVAWPIDNRTLTAKVSRRIHAVHEELLGLIEMRDIAGARQLMDDHVKMIRARRSSEHRKRPPQIDCC